VREKLTLSKDRWPEELKAMAGYGVPGVILATCNRAEFYTVEPGEAGARGGPAEDRLKAFLTDRFDVSLLDVDRFLYVRRGQQCVQHLFRVASSLDSMILGEEQIIGQVREGFDAAAQSGTLPSPVSLLFQRALSVGRKVRRETGIGRNALSVSTACVELAKNALGDLRGSRAVVVGAGDAGQLAAQVLARSGVKDITVSNRTHSRAVDLAQDLSGRAVPFRDLSDVLKAADIVIGCTGSPAYVLDAGDVEAAMESRPDRPLLLLDIAVPRDIDPAAAGIDNVFLHDVDDLDSVCRVSRQQKEAEAQWAEDLVSTETRRFLEWRRRLEVLPTVITLRNKADRIRETELNKTVKRLGDRLTAEEWASVEAMTQAIVKKLLHSPTMFLKGPLPPGHLAVAKEMLGLSEEEIDRESQT
jgi:glutamyl-tRNA reductase